MVGETADQALRQVNSFVVGRADGLPELPLTCSAKRTLMHIHVR